MTYREKEILDLIKNNPLISQKDLADKLGITRSSVAVHIANLMKKGLILGKGYIVPAEKDYVTIIGGANMDIQGFPNDSFNIHDSNPGKVKLSLGGVGRNIAENLAKLDLHVKLVTAVGKDVYGNTIINHCQSAGIDTSNTLVLNNRQTSTYLSILNGQGDMHVAIADMDIMDELNIEFVESKKDIVSTSKVCVLDTNLSKETLNFIVTHFKDVVFFVDTVSTAKAEKIKDIVGYFHTLKPNVYEVEMLTGIKPTNDEDLLRASQTLIDKGVKQVFITLGEEGLFYNNGDKYQRIKSPKVEVINATGAGDAFISGLVFGYMNDFSIDETAKFSMAASILALSHENTINPHLNYNTIFQRMEELSC